MKVFKCEYCNNNYRGNYKSHFCDKQLDNLTGNIKKELEMVQNCQVHYHLNHQNQQLQVISEVSDIIFKIIISCCELSV